MRVREWVLATFGNFSVTNLYQEATLATSSQKAKARVTLGRFEKEDFIQETGRYGEYHRVEITCEDIDFLNACEGEVDVKWPFGIEKLINNDAR